MNLIFRTLRNLSHSMLRWVPVWRRNFLVWRRLIWGSLIGNIAEPLITLLAFGYGFGVLVPTIDGVTYIAFLASGAICMNTFNAATFEALYSAYTRMHVQRSWEAILNAPLSLDDVVLAEFFWAASKSVFTGVAILAVIFVLGISRTPTMLAALPCFFLIGLTAAALALVVNALARSYETFTYYFTLVVTPMWFLSGVFFPVTQLPQWLQNIAQWLPLSAAVDIVRPLILGTTPVDWRRDLIVLVTYVVTGLFTALLLTRRRLLK